MEPVNAGPNKSVDHEGRSVGFFFFFQIGVNCRGERKLKTIRQISRRGCTKNDSKHLLNILNQFLCIPLC